MLLKLKSLLNKPSLIILVIIPIFIICVNYNQSTWKKRYIIVHDVISYYAYLPATFIDKDIKLSFINDSNQGNYFIENKYWPVKTSEGKNLIKMSMGLTYLYSPFFFIAHSLSKTLGYQADGFSEPYQFAIQFSGLFYLFISLIWLRKLLLKLYDEWIVFFSILIIYFGTNLVCYSTLQAPVSHQYNFFLFTGLIYFSINWLSTQKLRDAIFIGIFSGMLVIVRPTNIILSLFLLLYNIPSIIAFKARMLLLLKKLNHILLIILIAFLFFVPQIIYWKMITGKFLYFSYVGERFFFNHPHVVNILFDFRNGWLIYSPLMALSIVGIFFLYKSKSPYFLPIILILPIMLYVFSSWWCWWYGGAFGFRPMIDLYPILSFGVAALLKYIWQKTKVLKAITLSIIALFIFLNLFQTIQWHYNVIQYDSMTFAAYKNRLFKIDRFECDKSLLKRPDYELAKKGIDATVPFEGE
jgi:hypothetical protein